jgi:CheY-like chemotaxis protein
MSANPKGPILVVEDVSNIRELLDVTLTFKGYPVRTAADGEEALRIIAEERPALVISDILMPNLDGFGLIQRIRIDPKTRDIPIIMISATYVSEQDREFALKLGAVRFLEKPVDTDEFLLTVAEIMTQGPPGIPEPITDREFYLGYAERLERKLEQKETQIIRTERLLRSLQADQKPAFKGILKVEIGYRDAIRKELDQVRVLLAASGDDPGPAGES